MQEGGSKTDSSIALLLVVNRRNWSYCCCHERCESLQPHKKFARPIKTPPYVMSLGIALQKCQHFILNFSFVFRRLAMALYFVVDHDQSREAAQTISPEVEDEKQARRN